MTNAHIPEGTGHLLHFSTREMAHGDIFVEEVAEVIHDRIQERLDISGAAAPVRAEENLYFDADLPHYIAYVQEEARREKRPAPIVEYLEKQFSYMRPVSVMLRGKEYRRYSLNDIGAGGYKRVQKQLYISEETARVAADASVHPEKEDDFLETRSGEIVTALDHEMYMYSHLTKLLETHPFMSRYFLRFYGRAKHTETREICMSLELATGFEGHTSLRGMLVDIAKMARVSEVENDFADEEINALIERAKERVEYLKRHMVRFLADAVIALQFLHANHVVCSDLKPDNIFLHTDASGSYAKIGDFGGAMLMDNPDLQLKHIPLTKRYFDWEMMKNIVRGKVDARHTDLYALRECIEEFAEAEILPASLYNSMMSLPWEQIEKKKYAEEILPALQSILIMS